MNNFKNYQHYNLYDLLTDIQNNCIQPHLWNLLPKELSSMNAVATALIKKNPDYYFQLPDNFIHDPLYCLCYLDTSCELSGYGDDFNGIPKALRNEQFYFTYLDRGINKRRGTALFRKIKEFYDIEKKLIPDSLIVKGIEEDCKVLEYASLTIRDDYQLALRSVKNYQEQLVFVSERLKNDFDFLYDIIIAFPYSVKSLYRGFSEDFKKNMGLCEECSTEDIVHFFAEYKNKKELSRHLETSLALKDDSIHHRKKI